MNGAPLDSEVKGRGASGDGCMLMEPMPLIVAFGRRGIPSSIVIDVACAVVFVVPQMMETGTPINLMPENGKVTRPAKGLIWQMIVSQSSMHKKGR